MSRKLLVGLTGGIGTGKSLALKEFARLGAQTLSLDVLARGVVARGRLGYRRVLKAFGSGLLNSKGEIDRAKLGERVFKNASERRRLEKLIHPLILAEMNRRMKRLKGVAVVDVPLLFEAKLAKRFDVTLLLTLNPSTQLQRVVKRDALNSAEVQKRRDAQMPERLKRQLADVLVSNDGTRGDLKRKIKAYHGAFELMYGGA